MAQPLVQSSSFVDFHKSSVTTKIRRSQLRFLEIEQPHLRLLNFPNCNSSLQLKALKEPMILTKEMMDEKGTSGATQSGSDQFATLKHRFLDFKKDKYLKNLEHFKSLADVQSPKNGPTETNAALEFAVNSLKVENILVIGHSRCGGIHALMSMEDETTSSFIRSWVVIGKSAKRSTKAAASNLSFDHQCKHCEKESINCSLVNLLTYPWIKEGVNKGELLIHGGYYDFVDCTFEKWTLENNTRVDNQVSIRNREFWS